MLNAKDLTEQQVHAVKALRSAIRSSDVDSVQDIVRACPEVIDMVALEPWMCMAAKTNSVEMLRALHELGADPNLTGIGSDDGQNALSTAATKGQLNNVRFLHDIGTEIDVTKATRNPLFSSVFGRNTEVTKYLLETGMDAHQSYAIRPNNQQYDALAFALERGEREIASVIALHLAGGDAAGAQTELDRAWAVVRAVFEGQEGEDPPPPKIEPPYQ